MLVLTGTLLAGKYKVGERLGGGGMGDVYEAIQEGLGRKVAIKVVGGPFAGGPELMKRLEREARAVAALGHPHIVQVTDFQDNPGEPPFFVMERLAGESLGDFLDRSPTMEPRRIARVGEQVLSALAAAHEAGIVHRDVKPDNIFLCHTDTGEDLVKLLDFGVAKVLEEGPDSGRLTSTGAVIGTLAYMAPEQAKGEVVDAKADLYAVGAFMYHALTGRKPFDEPTIPRLLAAVCNEDPPPISTLRPDIDRALLSIVARAMAKQPSDWFSNAREMKSMLGAFLRGDGTLPDLFAHAKAGPSVPPVASPRVLVRGPQGTLQSPNQDAQHGGTGSPVARHVTSSGESRTGSSLLIVGAVLTVVGVGSIAGAIVWATRVARQTRSNVTVNETPSSTSITYSRSNGNEGTMGPVADTASAAAPIIVPTASAPPIAPIVPVITPPTPMVPAVPASVPVMAQSFGTSADTAKLYSTFTTAHASGDGKKCLEAYDQLKSRPDFVDNPSYLYMRADCTMAAGRCDDGRALMKKYWTDTPQTTMQKLGPVEIDNAVSGSAKQYCPPSQLSPRERAERAQLILMKAETNKDTPAIHKAADDLAATIPLLPQGTTDEKNRVTMYEQVVARAYANSGKCTEARAHYVNACTRTSPAHVDPCVEALLKSSGTCGTTTP